MDVPAKIAKAREALEQGHDRKAAGLLEEAVYDTYDPELLAEIRELALREQEKKGHRLKWGTWHDVLSEAELRLARPPKVVV